MKQYSTIVILLMLFCNTNSQVLSGNESLPVSEKKEENLLRNPVIPGFYPDPSICRVGEDYFLVNSSFEYFPGVPLFHSKDLIHWKQIGNVLNRKTQLNLENVPPSGGIFAPTLRFHNDTFYMVTTHKNKDANFYVWTTDPYGEWSDPVWLEQDKIDPSFFFDDDGKVYLQTAEGIFQSEIDLKSGKSMSAIKRIWPGGSGGSWIEAPHIYKKDGYYYLILAEGGTHYGHMVTVARSKNIWGPYEGNPDNPILTHRNTNLHPIQGTGHGDLIQDHHGDWWMVFLAFRINGQFFHTTGRETYIAPVTWENGWPVVNHGKDIPLEMEIPTLPIQKFPAEPVRDEFEGNSLSLKWNFMRNPPDNKYWSLSERRGWLTLKGTASNFDDKKPKTFIGRRLEDYHFDAAAKIDYQPQTSNEEAGLTLLMNSEHRYEIFISANTDGKRVVRTRYKIGNLSQVKNETTLPEGDVEFIISGDTKNYYLGYKMEGEEKPKILFQPRIRYLSSEVAGGFTGVYLGFFATGNGVDSETPAYFDYFKYQSFDDLKYDYFTYD